MSEVDFSRLPQPFLSSHPEWVALHQFAWRLAARHIRETRGRRHMDAAWDPGRNYQWTWDTSFMALYCRYAPDQYPGIESLDNFYDLQREDGYISMTYDMDTGTEPWPNRINPPLFAWVEWEYYRATGDASRLDRVIAHTERLVDWIDANRRNAPHRCRAATDGRPAGRGESERVYRLYYFADCGSSGMDDSPRTPRVPEAGQFFDWIDLSSQMALSFRTLGRMHSVLGNAGRAAHWEDRAKELGALINAELWCERTRFYHDRTIPQNFVAHKTVAGFWPVLAGICPEDRLDALVEHLANETEFDRPTPVPSLSADDLNYCPEGTYWVGGVWAPTDYMITRGLMNAGRGEVAHAIAVKYVGALARTYAAVEPHTLWECYCPEADRPGIAAYTRKRVKPDFVGWTGLGPIAMLIENVIGMDVNAPERRVDWDIRLTEEHGIRQLPIGRGGLADFHCEERGSPEDPARIRVCSDADIVIHVRRGPMSTVLDVKAGRELGAVV